MKTKKMKNLKTWVWKWELENEKLEGRKHKTKHSLKKEKQTNNKKLLDVNDARKLCAYGMWYHTR
jgi:hypothetical protein